MQAPITDVQARNLNEDERDQMSWQFPGDSRLTQRSPEYNELIYEIIELRDHLDSKEEIAHDLTQSIREISEHLNDELSDGEKLEKVSQIVLGTGLV